jgi:hypothetical protein
MNFQQKRSVALFTVATLLAVGVGCELVVDFDRSKIDGGTIEAGSNDATVDAGADTGPMPMMDSAMPDTATADTSPPPGDAGDAGDAKEETAPTDGGSDAKGDAKEDGGGDTGTVTDTGTADTGTADTGTADTGTADTGAADTGTADTGTADTGAADAGMDGGSDATTPNDGGSEAATDAPPG